MADKNEEPKPDDNHEKKIPVFTVVKNGSILKNIFLLDKPPMFPNLNSSTDSTKISVGCGAGREIQEVEEILVVGRHPDCNITLEHPSISRYHLKIHSKRSSQTLSVLDLSSVHGTWVSGKKIEPGVLVELQEGDTVRLGGSSRVYELHWVPVNRAYDLDHPFLPPLDKSIDDEEETHLDENGSCAETNGRQLPDADLECLGLLPSNDDHELLMMKLSLSAPLVSEDLNPTNCNEGEVENKIQMRQDEEDGQTSYSELLESDLNLPEAETNGWQLTDADLECLELLPSNDNHELPMMKLSLSAPLVSEELNPTNCDEWEVENKIEMRQDEEDGQTSCSELLERDLVLPEAETNEWQLPDADLECLELLPSNINHELPMMKVSLSAPLVSEGLNRSNCDEGEMENKIQVRQDQEDGQTFCSEQLESDLVLPESENQLLLLGEETENAQPLVCSGITSGIESVESPGKTKELLNFPNIWSRRGEVTCIQIQTGRRSVQIIPVDVGADIEPQNQDVENEIVYRSLVVSPDGDDEEIFAPGTENFMQNTDMTLVASPVGDEEELFPPDKENCLQNTYQMQSLKKTGSPEEIKQSKYCRLSPMRNAFSPCNHDERDIGTILNEENLETMQHELISKALFASAQGNEEDVFTPDKENFSPTTLLRRNINKIDKTEQIKQSESGRLSSTKNNFASDISQKDNLLLSSDSGIQSPKVLHERKSGEQASNNKTNLVSRTTKKRLPLQLLPVISGSKTKSNSSVLGASSRNCNSVNYAQSVDHQNAGGGGNKMWTMVVDTKCLLHRGSRKALQLLQGVKGTQLIIPRIVIRELDQMNLRGSLFRRTTEVSLALQWIENCLVNAKSWIHVQNSVEEGMPIAPTPRALPIARLTEEWGASPFSSAQIGTPTTEDHVLECALFFRRIMVDRQFVLLSDDVSMKIKSMAEGVICETAEEFRENLVNPFSERFLWTESSPRGPTWSCKDDILLRERYNKCPLKKPQSLKGLKLILLHNSQFKKNQFNQLNIQA